MKMKLLTAIFAIAIFFAKFSIAATEEVVGVNVQAQDGTTFSASFYSDGSWSGSGLAFDKDGNTIDLKIFDMAIDYELNTITVCTGQDENNFQCASLDYIEGPADLRKDWKNGEQADFKSVITTPPRFKTDRYFYGMPF